MGDPVDKKIVVSMVTIISLILGGETNPQDIQGDVLQPLGEALFELPENGGVYIPSTPNTVQWGSLPNRNTEPLLTVASGAVVTFDTVSHEGILEDQGRNPLMYFAQIQ